MSLLEDTSQRAIRYLEDLGKRGVAPIPEAVSELTKLEGDLPESSTDPNDVIAESDGIVSPATMDMAGRLAWRDRA